MARISRMSAGKPAWQNFDPTKAKLTKHQKEALKRKELQKICREAVQNEKFKYAFYEVNSGFLSDSYMRTHYVPQKEVKAISRFV